MVLFLILNVPPHLIDGGSTYGKSRVSFLPCKILLRNFLMNPFGRTLFQFPHKIGQQVRGSKLDQKVDVIRRTTDALAFPAKSVNGASQILMQTRTPCRANQCLTVFRGEDQVIVQAQECGRHACNPNRGKPRFAMLPVVSRPRDARAQPPARVLPSLRLGLTELSARQVRDGGAAGNRPGNLLLAQNNLREPGQRRSPYHLKFPRGASSGICRIRHKFGNGRRRSRRLF